MTTINLSAKDIVSIISCASKANVKELDYNGLKVVFKGEDQIITPEVKVYERPEDQIPEQSKEVIPEINNQNDDKSDLIYTNPLAFEETLLRME